MERDIEALRRVIDLIDHTLLAVINHRLEVTRHIGRLKREHGLPHRDEERERSLHTRLSLTNSGPMRDTTAARIFSLILSESRYQQALEGQPFERRPDEADGEDEA